MRHQFLLALLAGSLSSGARAKQSSATTELQSVCPSATVNYITQSLAQQCLRTDWSRPASDASSENQSSTVPSPILAEASITGGTATVNTNTVSTHAVSGAAANSADHGSDQAAAASIPGFEEEEGDPLSDNGNFLSFEEWKSQMLEKAGQSPDHIVGAAGGASGAGEARRRPAGINNALESLGDEGEIELDFSGFVNSETTPEMRPDSVAAPGKEQAEQAEDTPVPPTKRSKEAGTTSKERFNYASFDCAATVLKTNQGSKGATWILSENKDSYLINKCSEQSKYFIVELCNDILIDTIVLGNFEFFSSTFRTFRVSISDRYPVKADKWREIGTFEARNTRGVQAFMVEDGLIWARYLKVELLAHYGKEYYCPISLLRVHGTTMMDDYRNEMKDAQEQEDDGEEETPLVAGEEIAPPEVIPIPPIKPDVQVVTNAVVTSVISTVTTEAAATKESDTKSSEKAGHDAPAPTDAWDGIMNIASRDRLCGIDERPKLSTEEAPAITSGQASPVAPPEQSEARPTAGDSTAASKPVGPEALITQNATFIAPTTQVALSNITTTTMTASVDGQRTEQAAVSVATTPAHTEAVNSASPTQTTGSPSQNSIVSTSESATATTTPQTTSDIKVETKQQNSTSTTTKSKGKPPSPIKAALATPSTQDSFFRSMHKRLQMLEANSTLSLQYIEEQSRILRDAFGKAEKRQMQRTSNFLEILNGTVLGELRNFRIQYDQIWQSTVLELASQREQSQKEVRALGERLSLLADELVWQKRVVYLQFLLIVLCLGLMLFSKNGVAAGSSAPLELSLLQSIQNLGRGGSSVSFAKHFAGSFDSPPATPSRPTSMSSFFRRKSGHRREHSGGVTSGDDLATNPNSSPEHQRSQRLHVRLSSHGTTFESEDRSKSPSINMEPVTPASEREEVLGVKTDTESEEAQSPEADPAALKRAASSPPLGRQFELPGHDGQGVSGVESDIGGIDQQGS